MRAALVLTIALALHAPSVAHAERKELDTAQMASGIGTGASAALFISAFALAPDREDVHMPLLYVALGTSVITPALGHFYAGTYLTPGMAVRAGAALLATYAVLHYTQTVRCNTLVFMECTGLTGEAVIVLGVSAIAFVGGAALDFKTLRESVDEHNARFAITPTIMPTSSGPPGAGLVLSGLF